MQNYATIRKATVDAPKMRSCMMHPLQSTSAMPIIMPLQQPFSIARNESCQPSMEGAGLMEKKSSDEQPRNNTVLIPKWNVEKLERVPKSHALERTHVSLSNITAREITRRISDCFQKESIHAVFDDVRATAEAETIDNIHFIVRIFTTTCNKQTIVEVQRVLGCSYGFNKITRVILNAVKGITRSKPSNRAPASQIYRVIPTIPINQQKSEELIVESLEIAFNMLRSNRFDLHQLALDILLQMTSSSNNSNNSSDSSFAACKILCGSFLQTLVLQITKKSSTLTTKHQHSSSMRCRALTLLANCLGATEKSIKLDDSDSSGNDGLVLSLIEKLNASSTNPHDAYQAARCLRSLLLSSAQIGRLASMYNITDAASCAFTKGKASHTMLEKETKSLRILLAES